MKKEHRFFQYWPILVLAVLVVVFFWRTLFLGEMFVTPNLGVGEITIGGLPLRYYLSVELRSGNLPLWTDRLYAGYPIIAETTIAAFYPPNLVFFGLLPPVLAFQVNFAFAFFVAGLFTYLYCRLINLTRVAALLAAVAFVFSGYWTTHITHNIVIDTIAWFPVELFLVELLLLDKRSSPLPVSLLLGIVIAVQFLAGHAQFFFYSLSVLVLYFLFRSFLEGFGQRVWSRLLTLTLSMIIALGLSAVQLLPTLEYFRLSERSGGLSYAVINEHPFHLQELVTFVFPNFHGTPVNFTHNPPFPDKGIYWETTVYVGVLTLLLAGFSLVAVRNPKHVFFIVLVVFSLVMAVGGVGPLRQLLTVPPLGWFRIPSRFLFFTTFSLAILAGFGLDRLLVRISNIKRYLAVMVLLVVVADLFAFGYPFNPTYPAREWLATPQTVEILQADQTFFRILDVGLVTKSEENVYLQARKKERGWSGDLGTYRHLLNWVMPKANLFYGINQASGVMAFRLERTKVLDSLLAKNLVGEGQVKQIDASAVRLLNLLGVKYVVSPFAIDTDGFDLAGTTAEGVEPLFRVYENRGVLPNAFLVHSFESFSDSDEVLGKLVDEGFNPRETVLLENTQPSPDMSQAARSAGEDGPLQIQRSQDGGRVSIAARNSAPALLVLTDTYYPGWKADVDGRESRIMRADYWFRAVELPPGEHTVIFSYEPRSFWWGIRITLGTGILTLLGIAVLLLQGRLKTSGKVK